MDKQKILILLRRYSIDVDQLAFAEAKGRKVKGKIKERDVSARLLLKELFGQIDDNDFDRITNLFG